MDNLDERPRGKIVPESHDKQDASDHALTVAALEANRRGENEAFNERTGDIRQGIKSWEGAENEASCWFENAVMLQK